MIINTSLCNPKASNEAKKLMEYLGSVYRKRILTGQHTQTPEQKELWYIREKTGKLPAICGFELLGYSPNVNYAESDEECLKEVYENQNTIETALEWAEKYGGIVTYCWHWFSPMYGKHKSFYTEHTEFDIGKAMDEKAEEYAAIISDIDYIAEKLKIFRDKNIPILWRPLHEAEGGWFWWGAKGPEPCKKLWRLMYDRFTNYHGLNNLIWIWNSISLEWYPGDDCVDIMSCDHYSEPYDYNPLKEKFDKTNLPAAGNKMVAYTENGTIPHLEKAMEEEAHWLWFMTWSNDFGCTEKWTTNDHLCYTYKSNIAVTLDDVKIRFGKHNTM